MKLKKICRISGFLIAMVFLVFFAIMLIGEEIQNIKKFTLPKELIIPIILGLVCFTALMFSFKNPNLSGWVLIASGLAWFVYMLIVVGFDNIGVALLFGLVFIVSGVLFLPWQKN